MILISASPSASHLHKGLTQTAANPRQGERQAGSNTLILEVASMVTALVYCSRKTGGNPTSSVAAKDDKGTKGDA